MYQELNLFFESIDANINLQTSDINGVTTKYLYYTHHFNSFASDNPGINVMFRRIFFHFVNQKKLGIHSIESYSNKIELFIFYSFISIACYKSKTNLEANIVFLEQFAESPSIQQMTIRYYSNILSRHPLLTFDTLHRMSKRVVTVPMLRKLFGVKGLDLTKSQLIMCCPDCANVDLTEMVTMKYNLKNDTFLTHNYIVIKQFFANESPTLYNNLVTYEMTLVNRDILFTNPFDSSSTLRFGSRKSSKVLRKLRFGTPYGRDLIQLERSIFSQQQDKLQQYFG
jgi:hypothetical protein